MDKNYDINNLYDGFSETSYQEVNQLTKAIQAQEGITDTALLTDGGALQPQSLESSLALLLWQDKHLKFYKDLNVTKAESTLEEYAIQDGYGTEGGWVGQMDLPEEDDPDLRREFAVVKFIRTLWRVSDVIGLVKQIKKAEILAVQASIMRALRLVETGLFYSDSSVIPQSWDGLYTVLKNKASADNLIDLRGANISELNVRTGSEIIASNYGTVSKIYVSNSVKTTIDTLYGESNYRVEQTNKPGNLSIGHRIIDFKTSYGDPIIEPDIFLNREGEGVPKIKDPNNKAVLIEGKTSTKAPDTPSIVLTPVAPTVTGSLWKSTGDAGAIAGAYRYRVSAVNQYGKSAACTAVIDTVAAGGAMSIAITPAMTGQAATGFIIYREPTPNSGAGTERFMIEIPKVTSTVYVDKNENLPGTSVSFLVDLTSVGERRTMTFRQLAPIHKQPLAKIGAYKWGFTALYGTPIFYEPNRIVAFKNVGVNKAIRNRLIDL